MMFLLQKSHSYFRYSSVNKPRSTKRKKSQKEPQNKVSLTLGGLSDIFTNTLTKCKRSSMEGEEKKSKRMKKF